MLQKRIDDQPTISRAMVREAEDILHQHLKRVGLKQTEQRNTILRTFLETREHLSTDELHRLVKKKDARIGYTTVYRTLKLLADCGLASVVAFHDGIARYEHQYNRRSHHHMVCTECGSSVEFFSSDLDELNRRLDANTATSPRAIRFRFTECARSVGRKTGRDVQHRTLSQLECRLNHRYPFLVLIAAPKWPMGLRCVHIATTPFRMFPRK